MPAGASHPTPFAIRTVAVSGGAANTEASPDRFRDFIGAPVINNSGDVGFVSNLGSTSATASVWTESNGNLRLIAKAGDAAPTTGASFAEFSDMVVADHGIIAFKSTLVGSVIDETNRHSIWVDRSALLSLVTQAGQEAPHASGSLRFSSFDTPIAFSGDGHLALFARTRDKEGGNDQSSGIWTAGSNTVSLAAHAGMQATSNSPDVIFSPQSFEQPFANDAVISPRGQTIFRGFLTGPSVDDTNLNGLWSFRPSVGLELLVRAGDDAVGMNGAQFLSFPAVPTVNSAGDTAFLAFTSTSHDHDPLGSLRSDEIAPTLSLWLRRLSGDISQVLSIGDQAPGMAGGVSFVDTFDPIMNASSRVAFIAAVEGEGIDNTNELGLWSNGMSVDSKLQLIARQGDQAPGREEGFSLAVFLEPSMNSAGQTVFMASGFRQIDGAVVDGAFGIWGQDRTGKLRHVASMGQAIEVGPSDLRVIASLAFTSGTGGEDGKPRGFNDAGQVVFSATFTDGSSGVFVSNALTVPEPRPMSLILLLMIGACLNREICFADGLRNRGCK